MAEVKWIKITTDMFDNRKIKHLRRLPEGNSIVLIWVMLLTMAGRCNANGMVFLTENIPYTPKMLADELGFEENTVNLALNALGQLGMIVRDNDQFYIPGWEEHQNVEGLERIREQTRQRVARHRKKQKSLVACNDTGNVTVTQGNAADIEEEKEKDKDKDIDKEYIYAGSDEPNPLDGCMNPTVCPPGGYPEEEKPKKKKPTKHKYGEYRNVLLTDEELDKLKTRFPDWEDRIENLSLYIESKGARYKSHYATILSWARRDTAKMNKVPGNGPNGPQTGNKKTGTAEELDDFYNMMAEWAKEGE